MLRYDALYALTAVLGSPYFAYRLLSTGKWRTDWRGRFGHVGPVRSDGRPAILLHGVSVGEVSAARDLVAQLDDVGCRVVISSTTNTGIARARSLFGADHDVVRFPFDFTGMVRRLLDAVRPDVLVLMELEVWPNLVAECERRGIPVAVVNGRLSASSFRGYRRVRPFVRPMFGRLAAVGAQTDAYAGRFVELGTPAERVTVTDTMKWDNVELRTTVPGADDLAGALGIDRARPLVVAGSTGPGEERTLIDARPEGVQLLLVPRKPERFDEVARLVPGIVRRSGPAEGRAGDLFLLDTMGELEKAYALADVVVVGRSFAAMGGSDPIPPVALGKPTIIGTHHWNFDHVVEALADAAGLIVTDAPMRAAAELLDDPERRATMAERGRAVIRERQGASRRSAELVMALLRKPDGR